MKEQGFTIVEISLFLGISGALILLTLGLWTMVARQRFQDTMTTLRNTVQSEYEEVRTSINERLGKTTITGCKDDGTIGSGKDATGNSECLAIGKLIQFTPGSNEIKISYVVLTKAKLVDSYLGKGEIEILREISNNTTDDNKPRLVVVGSTSNSSYVARTSDPAIIPKNIRLQWGGEFANSWTITDTPSKSNGMAILHSPISGSVLAFSFASNATPVSSGGVLNLASASVNQPVAIMIKNTQQGFKGGAVCIDGGSSSVVARSAVPADPYYEFGNPTYSPTKENLKELCKV